VEGRGSALNPFCVRPVLLRRSGAVAFTNPGSVWRPRWLRSRRLLLGTQRSPLSLRFRGDFGNEFFARRRSSGTPPSLPFLPTPNETVFGSRPAIAHCDAFVTCDYLLLLFFRACFLSFSAPCFSSRRSASTPDPFSKRRARMLLGVGIWASRDRDQCTSDGANPDRESPPRSASIRRREESAPWSREEPGGSYTQGAPARRPTNWT